MKPVKDNFSTQAELYQKYRPTYPTELYNLILSHCKGFDLAWDCATGNGQVAQRISNNFKRIHATDISEKQLSFAPQIANVEYYLGRAESSGLTDNSVDLITVGQAIHWFDFEKFYQEVNRVLRPSGLIAVWTYGTFRVNDKVDSLIDHFYEKTVGSYWDIERRLIDEKYQTIPFPFKEIRTDKNFEIQKKWTLLELEGYLNTWSSVGHFKKKEGHNPVPKLISKIKPFWSEEDQTVFPIYLRLGK